LSRFLEKTDERYDGVGVRELVVNTVTVARVSNRSVRERKSDVLLVVPDRDSSAPAWKTSRAGEMSSAHDQIHWAASQWYAVSRRTTCPIAGNGK
jgi:hypothetical protein